MYQMCVCGCPCYSVLHYSCPCIPPKCGSGDIGTWKPESIVQDVDCFAVDRDGLDGLRDDLWWPPGDLGWSPGDQPPGLCGVLLQQSVALAAVQQVHTFSQRGELIMIICAVIIGWTDSRSARAKYARNRIWSTHKKVPIYPWEWFFVGY